MLVSKLKFGGRWVCELLVGGDACFVFVQFNETGYFSFIHSVPGWYVLL